jgi:hypothetical protein
VREGFTVEDIVVEDGAVVGIRGTATGGIGGRAGRDRDRRDGRNSRVAEAVRPSSTTRSPC